MFKKKQNRLPTNAKLTIVNIMVAIQKLPF